MRFVFPVLFAAVVCFSSISSAEAYDTHNSGTYITPVAHTSRPKAPPLKEMAGQEVDTEYFKVVIPAGWSMPTPVQKNPDGGFSALFASMSQSPAISISVMKTPGNAKQIGEMTLENMKSGGITSTPLKEKDGLWYSTLSGKGKGIAWFGDNNGTAAVTLIVGDNVEKADELLSVLSPKMQGLFPKRVK